MYTCMIDCQVRQNFTFFFFFSRKAASGFYLTNTENFITLKWIFGFSLNTPVAPLSSCKQKPTKYTLRYGIGIIGFFDNCKHCPLQNLLKCSCFRDRG